MDRKASNDFTENHSLNLSANEANNDLFNNFKPPAINFHDTIPKKDIFEYDK